MPDQIGELALGHGRDPALRIIDRLDEEQVMATRSAARKMQAKLIR